MEKIEQVLIRSNHTQYTATFNESCISLSIPSEASARIIPTFYDLQVDFTLSLEATQLNAAVGSARLTVFVDALSGRFSVGSSLLGGVASK